MKQLLNNFLEKYFHVNLVRTDSKPQIQIVEATDWDLETISICSKISMQSSERIWALINATKYIIQRDVPGSFVECGVWKGASAVAISRTLQSLGIDNRDIYLFDTFEGMTNPTVEDKRISDDASASALLQSSEVGDGDNIWAFASLNDVQAVLAMQDYPSQRFKIIQGDVVLTLGDFPQIDISLLRLDTDWYESTKVELEILFPKISDDGILIIDDFGHWDGSRRAVVEYFDSIQTKFLLSRIDYTGRILIKN